MAKTSDLNWRNYGVRVNVLGSNNTPGPLIPLSVFWPLYEATYSRDVEEGVTIAAFGAAVAVAAITGDRKLETFATISEGYKSILRELFGGFGIGGPWKERSDLAMSFTYDLLRTRQITREQAAVFASEMLREPKLDQELYRKRLNYWIKTHKLEPIRHAKRRPRKR